MTLAHEMGQRIAQARRELGVRERRDVLRKEMAAAAGVDPSSITEYEKGRQIPGEDVLQRLAEFLGVTPAYLRYGIAPQLNVGGQTITHEHTYTAEELAEARRIVAERERQKGAPHRKAR